MPPAAGGLRPSDPPNGVKGTGENISARVGVAAAGFPLKNFFSRGV
ncbi:MAG: hypothetical protein B193_3400, partial [Solidesulfovibrio magneticus str. Maddingley MBC34]